MSQEQQDIERLGALIDGKSYYQRWVESQGVPQIVASYIEDVDKLELARWDRKGGKGAFLNMEGTEDTNDMYICEIPPGGKLNPDRHMYEEMVIIISGQGATRIWLPNQRPIEFEWQEGSLFSLPLNAHYQHFNGTGKPARYLAVTTAPLVINLYHDLGFVFNCPYEFRNRFAGEEDFFSSPGTMHGVRIWETNFVSDVRSFALVPRTERGRDKNTKLEMANGSLAAHISEFPVGRYKKGHRHGPGAHVIILAGKGYSLLWREGEEPKRCDWHPGSILVPKDMEFHQHFNVGASPARYLAIRWGSQKNPVFKRYTGDQDIKEGGNQIDYADQKPWIHQMFLKELQSSGITCDMEEFADCLV